MQMIHPRGGRPLVPGVILASGWSQRMGRAKALLPAGPGGASFVRTLASTLRDGGIADILLAGRPDDDALRGEVSELGPGVRFVENPHARQGQITSIVAAVNVVDHPGVEGLLAVPVDQPLVAAATVATLIEAFAAGRPVIARANHRGRHGHPVVFARSLFEELRRADPALGARQVVRAHAAAILEVDVPDPYVILDIDDPAAYASVFGAPLPD
jgi:molybdenum cofactor cytidylyltransferase